MSCLRPRYISVKNQFPTPAFPESVFGVRVPCGKCVNCLKVRQLDYATRILREASKGQQMFFITLTYRNETLPFAKTLITDYVDTDTGELIRCQYRSEICPSDLPALPIIRKEILSMRSSSKARVLEKKICDSEDCSYSVAYTPSLNREDVKSWLKTSRIMFVRDFGYKLDFKYGICGEYGPRGCRPHYHLFTLGLNRSQVDYLCAEWKRRFGFTYVREVPLLNEDGSNARLAVSRYIGKYISKGKFDCDSVLNGLAFKGRLQNSRRLGTEFSPAEKAYFRCYDIYGPYDINTLYCEAFKDTLSKSMIDVLVKEIIKRNRIEFLDSGDVKSFHMPTALKRAIWYMRLPKLERDKFEFFKDSGLYRNYKYKVNGKNKEADNFAESKLCCPLILRKVADFLQSKFDADNKRKFKSFCSLWNLSEEDSRAYIKFAHLGKDDEETFLELREEFKIQTEYQYSKDRQ